MLISELKSKNFKELEEAYQSVGGQVDDPALMGEIEILMLLSYRHGLLQECEEQIILKRMMEEE